MIPLKDNIPRIRRPVVVWIIIGLNVLVFAFEMLLPEDWRQALIIAYGAIPKRFMDPQWAALAGFPDTRWITAVSYMFLHAGWLHIILNMWVLFVFADNVEDALGHWRFALFYMLSGLAALTLHVAVNSGSDQPVIGASGAIAGVMGAYFRLFPQGRVTVLIPIVFIPWIVEIPAVAFLGLWFAIQVVSGIAASMGDGESIAWWAHAGGFLFGMALARLLGTRDCRYCYVKENRSYERQEQQR